MLGAVHPDDINNINKQVQNRIHQNQNSYLNNSNVAVKTAVHKRRNISIGADRAGLDTAQ
jgi:hypothetical protein